MSDWSGTDWGAVIGAISTLLVAFGGAFAYLDKRQTARRLKQARGIDRAKSAEVRAVKKQCALYAEQVAFLRDQVVWLKAQLEACEQRERRRGR